MNNNYQDDYQTKYLTLKKKYNKLKGGILGSEAPQFIIHNSFPIIKDVDLDQVKVLNKNIRKMASNNGTKFISDIIIERLGSNITFTNVTPDIGSDLINYTYRFKNIITIDDEKDIVVSNILNHNINLYGLDLKIKKKNDKVTNVLKDRLMVQDVIYVDGFFLKNNGSSLTSNNNTTIYIDGVEISELVNMFKEKTKMFAFRLPVEYNLNNMFKEIDGIHYEVFSLKQKFYLVTIMTDQLQIT